MKKDTFNYQVERFDDFRIMRYDLNGFEALTLEQKLLIYYLSQAALCGRDIIYDQNYQYNLLVRKTLEALCLHYNGDRSDLEFINFEVYLKKVWFANGIHHHYSMDKFKPGFSPEYFISMFRDVPAMRFSLKEGQSLKEVAVQVSSIIFDPEIAPKRVSLDHQFDLLQTSACNYYQDVSEDEALSFYNSMKNPDDPFPVSHGLNSRLVKTNEGFEEQVYKLDGLFSKAIEKIIFWLKQAKNVAENEQQKKLIEALVDFYATGDLKKFDEYNILWVNELGAEVDFVNGFIEVYGDPLGIKASWESVVNYKDKLATHRAEIISKNAQWFEDHSPVDGRFKKKQVKGVSAKVINVAHLGGDCYPSTPIGINLPNADWIRKEHGSKSVTIENITYAYDQVSKDSGGLEEFCFNQEEIERAKKHGFLASNIHTDLHECLGHGSGQILEGVSSEALKNYASTLEEARADLFALYYMMDEKLIELGLFDTLEVAKAEYSAYIRSGLMTQLKRIEYGKNVEESHMRNRQLIAKWCFEKGQNEKIIERVKKDQKTYFRVNDFVKLRALFGELLAEVQRIKSEGDYNAGKELVERYGVIIDPVLHKEVLQRFERLQLPSFGGFVNPVFKLVSEGNEITDVKVSYEEGYAEQMLRYSKDFSFL